jgi:hypothetical protein
MTNTLPQNCRVDYYYERNGARTRTKRTLSVVYNLRQARSETAVLAYLRQHHPGCEITIMSLEWV